MVNSLSWILPFAIVMGSLVDSTLVYVYMKYVHQWKDILSSEEVLGPELEMEESNESSNESLVESPLGSHFRCHPDMLKHNSRIWHENSC